MTTEVESGTPAALHAELLAAAGPDRVLTPVALRRLLVGADKAALIEALSRVAREGVALPPAVAAQFGVPAGGPSPSTPDRSAPARTPDETPLTSGLPAKPTQKASGPRFMLELGQDSRLDLSALTIRTLRPDSVPSAPVPKSPARPDSHTADGAFEDSAACGPVFNPLKYYRKVINGYALLSRQQEAELAQAIEAGLLAREKLDASGRKMPPKLRRELQELVRIGEQAFTNFAQANLRLVVSIATWYTGRGLDLMDLIQEGNIGLLHAIDKFDHRKGFKFSTYAVPWIRQAIQRAVADQSRTVRLPVHAHDAVTALNKAARDLGHATPQTALPAVAAHAGIRLTEAQTLLSRVRRTVPLEDLAEAVGDDALHEMFDRATHEQRLEDETDYLALSPDEVRNLLSQLSPRQARVLVLRHGLEDGGPGLILDAIGRELGVTRERVRQIEKQAGDELRHLIVMYKMTGCIPAVRQAEPRSASPRLSTTRIVPAVPQATYTPEASPRSDPATPAVFTSERHRVNASGHVVVEGRAINVGAGLKAGTVVVLIEEALIRIIHDGRQLTTVPRRRIGRGGKTNGPKN